MRCALISCLLPPLVLHPLSLGFCPLPAASCLLSPTYSLKPGKAERSYCRTPDRLYRPFSLPPARCQLLCLCSYRRNFVRSFRNSALRQELLFDIRHLQRTVPLGGWSRLGIGAHALSRPPWPLTPIFLCEATSREVGMAPGSAGVSVPRFPGFDRPTASGSGALSSRHSLVPMSSVLRFSDSPFLRFSESPCLLFGRLPPFSREGTLNNRTPILE